MRGGVGRIRTTNQSIMSEVSTSGDRGESKRSDNVRFTFIIDSPIPAGEEHRVYGSEVAGLI
jgi:hypothetical protein